MISQSYIDGLTRQVFIRDFILNGMFPCQSDVVRSIRSKKRNWEFNDRFEYRMLLATTNTGGTLNSHVFNPDVSLRNPNELTYGIFKATYGTISDGFNVDLTVNLETQSAKGSFMTDYAMKVHSMRVNVASLFKNFAINGRYGVVHKITGPTDGGTGAGDQWPTGQDDETVIRTLFSASTTDPNSGIAYQYQPNPGLFIPFTLNVPMNVFASGFKTGRYLIKTTGTPGTVGGVTRLGGLVPWGTANVGEVYMILDNQPRKLTLVSVGTVTTPWVRGQYLELFGNRVAENAINTNQWGDPPASWNAGIAALPSLATLKIRRWNGTGFYTEGVPGVNSPNGASTGGMEGLSDLFPWYIDAAGNRLGLDLPFRNQRTRSMFSTEQAGGFYVRQPGESIINAIMNGVALTTATVPHAEVGVWMNPETMLAMGEQEVQDVKWVKQITSAAPLIYQRGVTSHDYQIGSKTIPATIQDYNIPTDIVIIGPRDDLSYNTWDNAMFEIEKYVQETFSSSEPPKANEISLPADFVTKLDFSKRITYGAPVLGDHAVTTEFYGGQFVHPSNSLPVAFHEMGALFTEAPFGYTIVHLRNQVSMPSQAANWRN